MQDYDYNQLMYRLQLKIIKSKNHKKNMYIAFMRYCINQKIQQQWQTIKK